MIFVLPSKAESRSLQLRLLPFRRGTGWGGRAKIDRWRGRAALDRSTPEGRREAILADYTGGLFLFGNERAVALVFPCAEWPPGEAIGATSYAAPIGRAAIATRGDHHRKGGVIITARGGVNVTTIRVRVPIQIHS